MPCASVTLTPTVPGLVGRKRRAHEVRIGVGDGEIDVQAIRLHDVGQQARLAARGDETAFGAHLAARQPRDRRANFRVRQLELGRAQRRHAAAATAASALSNAASAVSRSRRLASFCS